MRPHTLAAFAAAFILLAPAAAGAKVINFACKGGNGGREMAHFSVDTASHTMSSVEMHGPLSNVSVTGDMASGSMPFGPGVTTNVTINLKTGAAIVGRSDQAGQSAMVCTQS